MSTSIKTTLLADFLDTEQTVTTLNQQNNIVMIGGVEYKLEILDPSFKAGDLSELCKKAGDVAYAALKEFKINDLAEKITLTNSGKTIVIEDKEFKLSEKSQTALAVDAFYAAIVEEYEEEDEEEFEAQAPNQAESTTTLPPIPPLPSTPPPPSPAVLEEIPTPSKPVSKDAPLPTVDIKDLESAVKRAMDTFVKKNSAKWREIRNNPIKYKEFLEKVEKKIELSDNRIGIEQDYLNAINKIALAQIELDKANGIPIKSLKQESLLIIKQKINNS